jgi:tetratricopeptide (TPR) repeat protein
VIGTLKKSGLIFLVLFSGALNVLVYWNSHLYYQARKREDPAEKITILERANRFFPLNDLVFYELGKSYFDLGLRNLADPTSSRSFFQNAVHSLRRSVMINPVSPYSHFYLAQALLQLDLFPAASEKSDGLGEFKTSVRLAGENRQILFEVGRLLLSRWPELTEEDRSFTVETLRKVMAQREPEHIEELLNIWELNARDYGIMDKILPADAETYRQYARFLGEKSLSLEERHRFLARAELLEFEGAKSELRKGDNELSRFQAQAALGDYRNALDLLRGIKYYQAFTTQTLIDDRELTETWKSTFLNLAKCRIETGGGLAEVEKDLRQYLNLENLTSNIGDLEEYLRERRILPERFTGNLDDLSRLAFELTLSFRETKYREIVSFGRGLEKSLVVVPQDKSKVYVRIMNIIGDSLQKIDFLYDAGDFYRRALEVDPANLETLLRIRLNYDRLSEEAKLREVNKEITSVLTPQEVSFKKSTLEKGKIFSSALILDGHNIALDIRFDAMPGPSPALVSVFFNGRVAWDGYLRDGVVSLALGTKIGENLLQILPVNRAVNLTKIAYRINSGIGNSSALRSID